MRYVSRVWPLWLAIAGLTVHVAARGATPSAFERRCIPPGGVAPPSNIPDIATPPRKPRAAGAPVLGRRALPAGVPSAAAALGWSSGRIAALGATAAFRRGLLEGIRHFTHVDECQLLHFDVALLREVDECRRLADEPLVCQILARRRHAAHVEVPCEVALDLAARPHFADVP